MSPAGRIVLLAVVSLLTTAVLPFVGLERVPMSVITDPAGDDVASIIFWRIRLPRVAVGWLAGAALAIGGAAFQALFRNPLATPFTLGVASGAAFGVALVTRLGLTFAVLGAATDSLGALAGALLAVAVVWLLTRLRPATSPMVLLLAGVAMSFFFSSLILFLQYTASLGDSYRIVRWLMGGLAGVNGRDLLYMAPFVMIGVTTVVWRARELDLLTTGADLAASRGVNVIRTRKEIFLAASVMVGGVVAACGPIGFVGMMSPHICRLLIGSGHRHLLPASILFGGAFLAVCDTVARLAMAPAELPVGVITAFLGGPFFLWLLLRKVASHRSTDLG
jgi:iron complex transport system permease protein